MFRLLKFDHKRLVDNKKAVIILKYNKNRQKASLPGLPIFLGEGVAAHLGHQACRWPLRCVAWYDIIMWDLNSLILIWTFYFFGRLS